MSEYTRSYAADVDLRISEEIGAELDRQIMKWGVQVHPDGTDPFKPMSYIGLASVIRDQARDTCNRAASEDRVTWRHIMAEEIFEAFAEQSGSPGLRAELIQVAAVAISWVRDLDMSRMTADAEAEADADLMRTD